MMTSKIKVLPTERAVKMGYSFDKRKRRREHRLAAKQLIDGGTLLNTKAPRGSNSHTVAGWHLFQARYLGR